MRCLLRTDVDPEDPPEAICSCDDATRVCGSDGLVVSSRSPCRHAPVIVTEPKSITTKPGENIAFDCEADGWPVPDIEWRFSDLTNSNIIRDLPADDPNVAVQTRGGPNSFEVSGWLQVINAQDSNSGMYTCVAKNVEGESSASAKLFVSDQERSDA